MSVIGNRPVSNFQRIAKQTITGTGATAYSLDRSISSAADLAVFVNNVRQEPDVAYTAATTTITFSEAITGSDTVYVLYIGQSIGTVAHPGDQALSATTGTFSDALSGTTGTFSGGLSATTGTFTGALSGTTGTFTGDVYAPGHIIQVKQRISTAHETITAQSWTATGAYHTITPKSSSSKILVQITGVIRAYNNSGADARGAWRLYRDIGGGGYSQLGTHQMTHRSYDYGSSGSINDIPFHIQYLDSPATTSAVTYKLYGYREQGTAIELGPDAQDEQYVTLMEVAQ